MKFVDTHTHLNFEAFKEDADDVIKRSLENGLSSLIIVGTNLETSQKALELAEKHPNVRASVGIHPYHCLSTPEGFREDLEVMAESEKVVAIGETGLDFYKIKGHNQNSVLETKDIQLEILRSQLGLAIRFDLPVIIHSRKAAEAIISEIERYKGIKNQGKNRLRGVFHCFDSTWDTAQKILLNNFHISFTGIITYPEKDYLANVIKKVPNDRYMLETDSPYLTPEPKRKERNEPKNVKIIAEKIARLKGKTLQEIAKSTSTNARNLFSVQ